MNSYRGLSKNVMMMMMMMMMTTTTTMVSYPACHSLKTHWVDVEPVGPTLQCITAHVKAETTVGIILQVHRHRAVTFQHGRLVSVAIMTKRLMLQRLMLAASWLGKGRCLLGDSKVETMDAAVVGFALTTMTYVDVNDRAAAAAAASGHTPPSGR